MAKRLGGSVEKNKAAPCDAALRTPLGARLRWKEWLQLSLPGVPTRRNIPLSDRSQGLLFLAKFIMAGK
jgi:hypothetical protein